MLNPMVSVTVYLTEMLISYIFFSNVFEKRLSSRKCLLIGCLLFAMGSVTNILFGNNGVINSLVTVFLNSLFAHFCFDGKLKLSLFYSSIITVINGTLEITVVALISMLTKNSFLDYNSSFPLLVLECSICKVLYFLIILVFSRIVKPSSNTPTLPFNFFLYPIAATVCFSIFWYISTQTNTPYKIQNLLAIASLILLASTVLLFVTYQSQIEKDRESLQMKSEFARLQTEKSYYQILEQQNQQLMLYAHDAKNHLAAIKSLNTDPQISGYISKLSAQLADYTRNCHSGNKLLDVMIHKYIVDCEMRGISFDYDVKLCNLNEIEDIDLVAILGNLIDNALTAAEKSDGKNVSLATARRNSYSIIVVSNSCDTPPKTRGVHLVSSKADQKLHGFGLKSVSKTLKKYQGDFEWDYNSEEHIFSVIAMVGEAADKKAASE